MKKIYFAIFLFSFSFLAGCSKDFLKSYEDRIVGTWQLTDVDRRGIGGSINNLIFQGGQFQFLESGDFVYTREDGQLYNGNWRMDRDWIRGNCNGAGDCDDRTVRMLSVVGVNFTTQDIKADDFDEVQFTGTNRFNAFIYSGAHTYVFRFRR